jgi:hypothetical protein
MVGTRSEDTLLFLGLTPKLTKLKSIYKMLTDFATQKQSLDFSDRFNIILFQESGPLYLNDFTLTFDNILKLLQDYEKKIVRANIAGGIFVAVTFIIDVYKRISDKAFRLILFTDKGSLKVPDHYVPVLIDLIDKVKDMPLYIDVLRLGTQDYEEDVKLDKLARRSNGKIYGIKSPKQLEETLARLAKKRTFSEDAHFMHSAPTGIMEANKPFYENLAEQPHILVSLETCSICFKKDDRTVVQCPNCDTIAHMECWAHWAKTANIGIKNVLRCHNCFNLLKLDKTFVEIVQEGKEPPPEVVPKKVDLMSYLQDLEAKNVPEVVQAADPLGVPEEDIPELDKTLTFSEADLEPIPAPEIKDFTPVRERIEFSVPEPVELEPIPRFGEERTPEPSRLQAIPTVSDLLRTEATPQPVPKPVEVKKPEPTPPPPIPETPKLTPAERRRQRRMEGTVSVVFCPSCSGITTSKEKFCPKCGHSL